MSFINYMIRKNPDLMSSYFKIIGEWIQDRVNEVIRDMNIFYDEWIDEEDIKKIDVSFSIKYMALHSAILFLLEENNFSELLIKKIFDDMENYLSEIENDEEELEQIEVFILESMINRLSHYPAKSDLVYGLLGERTRAMWNKNIDLWNAHNAINLASFIRNSNQ
jgi:hypothetical protein